MHQHVTLIAAFGCQIFRTGQVFLDCFGIVGIFFAVGCKCAELQEIKQTHQGKNAESAWSRGQAWGVYGYTSCYRETRDTAFLQEAVHIADMIMERVKTDDLIPYWDYDAPAGEKTPRDASAAAVTASAFLELSTFAPDGKKYSDYAETILKNLSGPKYLAAKGSNQGYVLMHSTGSLPHGSEIDVPLNYADYYYMEALKRYIDLKNKG